MNNKPQFITFTGIDADTDMLEAHTLANDYPIEFGVLFSPSRQGVEPRYPDLNAVNRIIYFSSDFRLSAHLCGGHSRSLLASAETMLDDLILAHFDRVQINTALHGIDTAAIRDWAAPLGATPILQCRDQFPEDENVTWLFDASGGRGIAPAAWPKPAPSKSYHTPLLGYAGGLNPANVAAAVAAIGKHDECYWIDMESGVRDEQDRFDLGKCRAVCEAVYGKKAAGCLLNGVEHNGFPS